LANSFIGGEFRTGEDKLDIAAFPERLGNSIKKDNRLAASLAQECDDPLQQFLPSLRIMVRDVFAVPDEVVPVNQVHA